MTTDATHTRERFLGLDLIRLIGFLAILIFHADWIIFYGDHPEYVRVSITWLIGEYFAYTFAFSGFTILFLTCLLQGFNGFTSIKRVRLLSFLLIGWAIFSYLIAKETPFFFVWDVYPLLFTGLLVACAVESVNRNLLYALGFLGTLMLCIPFWNYENWASSLFMKQIWYGDCESDLADWPVLPWIGLVWSGYAAGIWLRAKRLAAPDPKKFFEFTRTELLGWIPFLVAGVTQWGPYAHVRLGARFGCETFRQPPLVFLGHFAWITFCIRASFDSRVQTFLKNNLIARKIGEFGTSRKFWMAYVLHYLILNVFAIGSPEFWYAHTMLGNCVMPGAFVLTEISTRIGIRAQNYWALRSKYSRV